MAEIMSRLFCIDLHQIVLTLYGFGLAAGERARDVENVTPILPGGRSKSIHGLFCVACSFPAADTVKVFRAHEK